MEMRAHAVPASLTERRDAAPAVLDLDHPGLAVPDYAALYPLPEHTGSVAVRGEDAPSFGCAHWADGTCVRCALILTPRLAYLLHTGAELAKGAFDEACDLVEHGALATSALVELLPVPVLRYLDRLPEADAAVWLGRFSVTLEVVMARLAVGEVPTPRCTAEEMAVHLAIDEAEGWVDLIASGEAEDRTFEALPADDHERDRDVRHLSEVLFEDHDVLWLFDPKLDGVDDDAGVAAAYLGTANLHARDWFTSFRPEENPAPELLPVKAVFFG